MIDRMLHRSPRTALLAACAAAALVLWGCSDHSTNPPVPPPAPLRWQVLAPLPIAYDLNAAQWIGPGEFVGVGRAGRIIHYNGVWIDMLTDVEVNQDLWAISGTALDDLVAVGDHGEVTKCTGVWWPPDTSGVDADLRGVWRSPSGAAWAVGNDGVIIRDDGAGWTRMTSPALEPLFAVWGTSDHDVFAVGAQGTAVHFDGADWELMNTGTTETLAGVSGADSAAVIAVGNRGTALRYDGTTWQPQGSNTAEVLQAVRVFDRTDAIAVGSNGALLRYDGAAWTPVDGPTHEWLYGVTGDSSDDIFAVGSRTVLHRDGAGWSALTAGATRALNGASVSPEGRMMVVGERGTMLRYAGDRWMRPSPDTTIVSDINAVWAASASDITVVGDGGRIIHFDGAHWNAPFDIGPDYHDIWGSDDGSLWVVGNSGRIMHRGATGGWLADASHTTRDLYGVWGESADHVFAVGVAGEILERTDTWHRVATPTLEFLYDVGGWKDHTSDLSLHVVAVGDAGLILERDPDTGAWAPVESGVDVDLYAVCEARDGVLLAAGEGGVALVLSGGEWTRADAPTTKDIRGLAPIPTGGAIAVGGTSIFDGTALLFAPE